MSSNNCNEEIKDLKEKLAIAYKDRDLAMAVISKIVNLPKNSNEYARMLYILKNSYFGLEKEAFNHVIGSGTMIAYPAPDPEKRIPITEHLQELLAD